MNQPSDDEITRMLRSAMPLEGSPFPAVDLWPRVRHRIEEAPGRPRIGDYVLAAAALTLCLVQPSLVTLLLLLF